MTVPPISIVEHELRSLGVEIPDVDTFVFALLLGYSLGRERLGTEDEIRRTVRVHVMARGGTVRPSV